MSTRGNQPEINKLVVKNRIEEVGRLNDWWLALAAELRIDADTIHAVQLCLDEAVTNVISHGYGPDENREIEVFCERDGAGLRLIVSDGAAPFDPLSVPPAQPAASLEEATVGGWGVQLIRSFTHAVDYERRGDTNRLTMSFQPAEAH